MDEGFPIAYQVLEKGVPVLASDGTEVGTVHHVVSAPEKDIFHGVVIKTPATACASWKPRTSSRCTNAGSTCASTRRPPRACPSREAARQSSTRTPGEIKGWQPLGAQVDTGRKDWNRQTLS